MKTIIHHQQNTSSMTRTFALTLLAFMFGAFAFAANTTVTEQDTTKADLAEITRGSSMLKKQEVNLEDDLKYMDSVAINGLAIQQELVKGILENEKIIESQAEVNPAAFFEVPVEETIRENNQLIESSLDNTTYPLNMERIKLLEHLNKNADLKNRVFQKKIIKS